MTKLVIDQIGGMCPVQGYGTVNDEPFYFRFRSDCAQLYVGPIDEEDGIPADPPRLYAEINDVYNEPFRGYLSGEESRALLWRLVELLKPNQETQRDRLVKYLEKLRDSQ